MTLPRVIVRRHLPWPLRWAAAALVLGFSGAIALWAFELGKDLAGLDRAAREELGRLRQEVVQLREENARAASVPLTVRVALVVTLSVLLVPVSLLRLTVGVATVVSRVKIRFSEASLVFPAASTWRTATV